MTPTEQDNELREAIRKDFHQLLVKEFTADWKIQRIVRDLEIDVISLDNTMQLITADRKRVALEAELKVWMRLKAGDGLSTHDGCFEIHPDYINEQIAQLKAQQEKL